MKGRCVRPSWMLMGTGLAFLPAYGYKNEAVCEDSIKDQIKTLSESKSLDQKTKTFIKQSLNIYNDYSNGRDIHATDIKKLKTLGNQILHDNFNSTIPSKYRCIDLILLHTTS